jgi:peptidoglycan/xylan/chitin deacetylase (PgdA/CDA1 family)
MLFLIIIIAAAGVLFMYFGIPWFVKKLIRRHFLRRVKRSGAVCLTFDDGPNPPYTRQIVEMLNEYGAAATFFMVGKNMERNPDLVEFVFSSGNEIGEHGYIHVHPWKCDPVTSYRDLSRNARFFANTVIADTQVQFRPPFGKLTLSTLLYLIIKGRSIAFWNIDPHDYAQTGADAIISDVKRAVRSGSVILLHDGRKGGGGDASITVSALRGILDYCTGAGVRLSTVGQAIYEGSLVKTRAKG